jgi:hypothetical protein
MAYDFDAARAEPYGFMIEADLWAWFDGGDCAEFDSEAERRATIPTGLFAALEGKAEYDPSLCSMRAYTTQESAMDALMRAIDREYGGAFVEPVEVVE